MPKATCHKFAVFALIFLWSSTAFSSPQFVGSLKALQEGAQKMIVKRLVPSHRWQRTSLNAQMGLHSPNTAACISTDARNLAMNKMATNASRSGAPVGRFSSLNGLIRCLNSLPAGTTNLILGAHGYADKVGPMNRHNYQIVAMAIRKAGVKHVNLASCSAGRNAWKKNADGTPFESLPKLLARDSDADVTSYTEDIYMNASQGFAKVPNTIAITWTSGSSGRNANHVGAADGNEGGRTFVNNTPGESFFTEWNANNFRGLFGGRIAASDHPARKWGRGLFPFARWPFLGRRFQGESNSRRTGNSVSAHRSTRPQRDPSTETENKQGASSTEGQPTSNSNTSQNTAAKSAQKTTANSLNTRNTARINSPVISFPSQTRSPKNLKLSSAKSTRVGKTINRRRVTSSRLIARVRPRRPRSLRPRTLFRPLQVRQVRK